MKRSTLIVLSAMLALAPFSAGAEGNPYGIDQQCYEYFVMAENLVSDTSNEAFEVANEALLRRALECGDEKARTLYYVEELKRATRFVRSDKDRDTVNEMVEKTRMQLLDVAEETGYRQYYYYAYDLAQTYYVNSKQEVRAQQLLNEMFATAHRNGDDYGRWCAERFLGTLFLNQLDRPNAKKHFKDAIRTYENSSDPLIRRQSITRVCCDISETYAPGSDSARFYINMAERGAVLHQDSVRCDYYKAQLAVLDGRMDEYRSIRDRLLSDPYLFSGVRVQKSFFDCIEGVIGNMSQAEFEEKIKHVQYVHQLVLLREIAIRSKRWDLAASAGNSLINSLYSSISKMNAMRLEEVSSTHEKYEISLELARQQRHIRTITTLVLVLVVIILALALVFVIWFLPKKKKGPESETKQLLN